MRLRALSGIDPQARTTTFYAYTGTSKKRMNELPTVSMTGGDPPYG
ncbi:MAG TPA: hypothetical protein VFF31_04135 [Blastocatellia bacterium]|nr:hypothetical protein [Blastocatellia bacterium]